MNYYGNTILEQEELANKMIRIVVSMYGSEVEYIVSQEELTNANIVTE